MFSKVTKSVFLASIDTGKAAFRHFIISPGVLLTAAILYIGPGKIYDKVTDIDTALLYETLNLAIKAQPISDTYKNRDLIHNKFTDETNQVVKAPPELIEFETEINKQLQFTEPYPIAPRTFLVSTATAAQERLNNTLDKRQHSDTARNVLSHTLIDFESSKNELKHAFTLALANIWMIAGGISFLCETAFRSFFRNRNREQHSYD